VGIERQFAQKVKGRPVKAMATHPIGVDRSLSVDDDWFRSETEHPMKHFETGRGPPSARAATQNW
jgi:hypothetical protein